MMEYYDTIMTKHKKVFSRRRRNRKQLPSYFNFFDNLPGYEKREKSFIVMDRAVVNYKRWKREKTLVKREDIVFVLHDLKNLEKLKVSEISGVLQVSDSTIRNWIRRFSV